ncbi:MAG TPA: 1-deoxy-D-xylulose-5-phosphate synthase [Chitinivibrionales bacterium]
MTILEGITCPADLKKCTVEQLSQVAAEIRGVMLENVSRTGGHLASSLGAVELTLALHYVYDSPADKLVWDVGHQSYAHKILTGRRERFGTLRQFGGISGFPRVGENEHDAVSVGHASTSISAGLGLAIGRDLLGERGSVVAVIGDGSLSGGLAFEGLNNLGSLSTNMTVVLNDNRMSISKNVGALSRYLLRVITDRRFNKVKDELWELTGRLSGVGKRIRSLVSGVDEALKHFVIPDKLFEDLGLRYFGPVDGHNIAEMIEVFRFVRESTVGPVLVHVITTKGKGYSFAESDATKYHGVGSFSVSTGTSIAPAASVPSYSDLFGAEICAWARKRTDIVAITAGMPDGTGLSGFAKEFPNRFFDVGIAESHAVTFAAGLALKGLKPVVPLYSTFLQRAFDQIIHDVALDKINVTLCIDRAGIVGEDGPTHHGAFDCSYLRAIPNVVVMAPRNGWELRRMLHAAMLYQSGPVFIRYPRGGCIDAGPQESVEPIPLFEPEIVEEGTACAVVALGDAFVNAQAACEILAKSGIRPELVNARFVKPLSQAFYAELFKRHRAVVTVENNALTGGFGAGLIELAASIDARQVPAFLRLGYPDEFIAHGAMKLLAEKLELDGAALARRIQKFLTV